MTDTQPSAPKRTDIKALVAPLKRAADKIRDERDTTEIDQLTPQLLEALLPLLDRPTPDGALKYDEGDYVTVHMIWQVRSMDALFGRRHWRWLVHFRDDQTATAHVLIGNNLTRVKIDKDSGGLVVPEEAEILLPYEGDGAVGMLDTRGATHKAARTSALRSLLALIGFGGDVTMLARRYEPHRTPPAAAPAAISAPPPPAQEVHAPPPARHLHAVADAEEREAIGLLVMEIRGLATERQIPASQLVLLIGQAVGVEQSTLPESEAQWRVNVMLDSTKPRLQMDQAVTLRALVEQAEPQLPVIHPADRDRPGGQPATADAA